VVGDVACGHAASQHASCQFLYRHQEASAAQTPRPFK
jgi:hypothetical protein